MSWVEEITALKESKNGQMRNSESKCLREVKIIENDNLQERKLGNQFFVIRMFIGQTFFSLPLEPVPFRIFE